MKPLNELQRQKSSRYIYLTKKVRDLQSICNIFTVRKNV